jgi:hypothetical protein
MERHCYRLLTKTAQKPVENWHAIRTTENIIKILYVTGKGNHTDMVEKCLNLQWIQTWYTSKRQTYIWRQCATGRTGTERIALVAILFTCVLHIFIVASAHLAMGGKSYFKQPASQWLLQLAKLQFIPHIYYLLDTLIQLIFTIFHVRKTWTLTYIITEQVRMPHRRNTSQAPTQMHSFHSW